MSRDPRRRMYARKRLDIGWLDLVHGLGACAFAWDEARARQRVEPVDPVLRVGDAPGGQAAEGISGHGKAPSVGMVAEEVQGAWPCAPTAAGMS